MNYKDNELTQEKLKIQQEIYEYIDRAGFLGLVNPEFHKVNFAYDTKEEMLKELERYKKIVYDLELERENFSYSRNKGKWNI